MTTPLPLALLAPLSIGVLLLAGCPDQDGVSTSTSATESSSSEGDSDGDPNTNSPTTSTTAPEEPTSSSTTVPDSDPTTTEGPPDTTTGSPTEATTDEGTTGSTTEGATSSGSTGGDPECGNGLLEPREECDEGGENADGDYGGCNLDCTLQPFCGDGVTQSELGEDCDPSDEELVEAAVCTDVCTWSGVIAFVTSESYTGDLGGTDGAHEKCAVLAEAAGLINPEGYRAWISVGSHNPEAGIPKVDDAYYRLDGKSIAASSQELFGGKLKNPLSIDENKSPVTAQVWTNTTYSGLAASDEADCQSFSSLDGKQTGIVGRTKETGPSWTQHMVQASCIQASRLYCFSEAF